MYSCAFLKGEATLELVRGDLMNRRVVSEKTCLLSVYILNPVISYLVISSLFDLNLFP